MFPRNRSSPRGRPRWKRTRRRRRPAATSASTWRARRCTACAAARATRSNFFQTTRSSANRSRLWAGPRVSSDMARARPLKIGITCYPSVGGSGIMASELGEELAARGHEVHFISYERPFRVPADRPRLKFHQVVINDYGLFKYPDYTLPLSVKMAEVTRDVGLDVLHLHYAVPHATAAILARDMLPKSKRPRVVTTLHGTDTTLLGRDTGYGPAIAHALKCSDAITTVSNYLKGETESLLNVG